jgi:hypothetical protein
VQEEHAQLRLWKVMHDGQAHELKCVLDFLLTEVEETADLAAPREKAVENAETLRGAAIATARMEAENFMVALCCVEALRQVAPPSS